MNRQLGALHRRLSANTEGMGFPAAADSTLPNFEAEANHRDEIVQTASVGGGSGCRRIISSAERRRRTPTGSADSAAKAAPAPKAPRAAFTIDRDALRLRYRRPRDADGQRATRQASRRTRAITSFDSGSVAVDFILSGAEHPSLAGHPAWTSLADATHDPPIPLTITSNGSGTVWMLIGSGSRRPIPAASRPATMSKSIKPTAIRFPTPLVNGGSYYGSIGVIDRSTRDDSTASWPMAPECSPIPKRKRGRISRSR